MGDAVLALDCSAVEGTKMAEKLISHLGDILEVFQRIFNHLTTWSFLVFRSVQKFFFF